MHSSERAVQPWPPAACFRAARVYYPVGPGRVVRAGARVRPVHACEQGAVQARVRQGCSYLAGVHLLRDSPPTLITDGRKSGSAHALVAKEKRVNRHRDWVIPSGLLDCEFTDVALAPPMHLIKAV